MNSPQHAIPNHMVWTVLATVAATILCCPLGLLGIVGIVKSSKVNGLIAQGDIPGAQRASAEAKTWAKIATGLAAIGVVFSLWFQLGGGKDGVIRYMESQQRAAQQR